MTQPPKEREDGTRDLIKRIQSAVDGVDFEDVSGDQKREYCKAGARRVLRAVNAAIDGHNSARALASLSTKGEG